MGAKRKDFSQTKGLRKDSKTGIPGVTTRPRANGQVAYSVFIHSKGQEPFCRTFDSLEEATQVARAKRLEWNNNGPKVKVPSGTSKSMASAHQRFHVGRNKLSKYCPLCLRPKNKTGATFQQEETEEQAIAAVAW